MNLISVKKEVLSALFDSYRQQPGSNLNVSEIIKRHNYEPFDVVNNLKDEGLVKNVMNIVPKGVFCEITIDGIAELHPDFVDERRDKIISTLGLIGGRGSIVEVLDTKPNEFSMARDFAILLYEEGYLKQPLFSHNDGQIELSLNGQEYFNENKANWIK